MNELEAESPGEVSALFDDELADESEGEVLS